MSLPLCPTPSWPRSTVKRSPPDSCHLHYQIHHSSQQQTTTASPSAIVKVELKHFLLRSYDINLAIVLPSAPQASHLFNFKSSYPPPVFLCKLTTDSSEQADWVFGFPFACSEDGDENCSRIGEVLARKFGRNPLIIGVCPKGDVQRIPLIIVVCSKGILKRILDDVKRWETRNFARWTCWIELDPHRDGDI
ncbi:protein SMAX1-LIKE 7-like [Punica granatum]|uniref:Protein SMAX1-LIKE 7-like n=1 Tax=Punica granatum TaxID=22663 RepID=A0A218XV45_PUNGR|nr:protein SMAX1-LIKE 7-like [Punica granatum]XP_031371393.1 protein SMAX1-LIKE 7-like [Punica granatum]XP_031371394.1 protein SMAX1-LIKE 7-like [Punica granatum]OWM88506.1 hypothetical protein CDL15_Pgr012672 [Punica granatum]